MQNYHTEGLHQPAKHVKAAVLLKTIKEMGHIGTTTDSICYAIYNSAETNLRRYKISHLVKNLITYGTSWSLFVVFVRSKHYTISSRIQCSLFATYSRTSSGYILLLSSYVCQCLRSVLFFLRNKSQCFKKKKVIFPFLQEHKSS
jgi:hypothetical protein